jgi:hypothetical protein
MEKNNNTLVKSSSRSMLRRTAVSNVLLKTYEHKQFE